MPNFAFGPGEVSVSPGTTVRWTNDSSFRHTVTSDGSGGILGSDELGAGSTFEHTFEEPGSFPYHCDIHYFMEGTVTVS